MDKILLCDNLLPMNHNLFYLFILPTQVHYINSVHAFNYEFTGELEACAPLFQHEM